MRQTTTPSPGPVGMLDAIAAVGYVATFVVSILLALSGDFVLERLVFALMFLLFGWLATGLVFVFTRLAQNVVEIADAVRRLDERTSS